MARVSFIAEEDASPEVRGVYARQRAHLGQVLTTARVGALPGAAAGHRGVTGGAGA